MEVAERPKRAEIEDRAEVDVEALIALSSEDLAFTGQRLDRRVCERGVSGRGARADAHRWRDQIGAEDGLRSAIAALGHTRHRVELPHVPRWARQRRDRTGVVEERVRVAKDGAEAELVRDVLDRVTVVVDLDLVENVVAELKEVRAAGRLLQRNVVRDDRHFRRVVRIDERVQVGVVRDRVLGDLRGFTM